MCLRKLIALCCIVLQLLVAVDPVYAQRNHWNTVNKKLNQLVNKSKGVATLPSSIIVNESTQLIDLVRDRTLSFSATMEEIAQGTVDSAKKFLGISEYDMFLELVALEQVLIGTGFMPILAKIAKSEESLTGADLDELERKILPVSVNKINVLRAMRLVRVELARQTTSLSDNLWSTSTIGIDLAKVYLDNARQLLQVLSAFTPAEVIHETVDEFVDATVNIFDPECGYRPVPVRFGGVLVPVPFDRSVPSSCAGDGEAFADAVFVPVSRIPALQLIANSQPRQDAGRNVPYQVFYKGNAGYALEIAVDADVQISRAAAFQAAALGKFPIAWSKPSPSARTLSLTPAGDIVSDAKRGLFSMTPAFEIKGTVFENTMPVAAALSAVFEFPISCGTIPENTGCLLNQLNLKANGELIFDWKASEEFENIKAGVDAARKLMKIVSSVPELKPLLDAYARYNPQTQLTLALKERVPVLSPMLNTASVMLTMLGHALAGDGLDNAAVGEDPGFDFLNEPSLSLKIISKFGSFLGWNPANILGQVGAIFLLETNLDVLHKLLEDRFALQTKGSLKIGINFGHLNALHVQALADKSPSSSPKMGAGFKLVRSGEPDYIALEITQRPDILSKKIEFPIGPSKLGFSLNGPYKWFKAATVQPVTYAGKLYIDNGSPQYEPLSVPVE